MTLPGHVSNGVVVLDNGATLPDGILVQVTPAPYEAGNALAVLAEETSGQVSKERREALLRLIGCCKSDNPPHDEEVERIIDEYRMKKYG